MKRIKIEVSCLFVLFAILAITVGVEDDAFRYIGSCGSTLGIAVLVYQIMNELQSWLKQTLTTRDAELKKLSNDLAGSIEKYGTEQSECTGKLTSVMESLSNATEQYIKRVDALAEIQEDIVEEETNLRGEISKMSSNVATNLADLSAKVQNCLTENEKSIEGILSSFCADFKDAQESANDTINIAKESMNALKAQVKVSLDTFKQEMREQTNAITEGLEDCSDNIEAGLGEYRKEQEKRDTAQNEKILAEIESINQTVEKSTGAAIEENAKLLKYLQQVQEDWTTLSKDEIAFLNKLWAE